MGTTLNKETYEKLINADIEELEKYMPEYPLEKKHAISVLKDSVDFYYQPSEGNKLKQSSSNCARAGTSLNMFKLYNEALTAHNYSDFCSKLHKMIKDEL